MGEQWNIREEKQAATTQAAAAGNCDCTRHLNRSLDTNGVGGRRAAEHNDTYPMVTDMPARPQLLPRLSHARYGGTGVMYMCDRQPPKCTKWCAAVQRSSPAICFHGHVVYVEVLFV